MQNEDAEDGLRHDISIHIFHACFINLTRLFRICNIQNINHINNFLLLKVKLKVLSCLVYTTLQHIM